MSAHIRLLAAVPAKASADTYATRRVRVLVARSTGSRTDIAARAHEPRTAG
jgi:tripartite-type tricarboxylate transporter receptor subunit TctC